MSDLVDLVTPVLWHTARAQHLDSGTAEGVIQTAWIRLIEHADSIKDAQAVLGWLITTVRREAWRVSRGAGHANPPTRSPGARPRAAPIASARPQLLAVLHEGQRTLAARCDAPRASGTSTRRCLRRPPRLRHSLTSIGYAGRLDRSHTWPVFGQVAGCAARRSWMEPLVTTPADGKLRRQPSRPLSPSTTSTGASSPPPVETIARLDPVPAGLTDRIKFEITSRPP